MTIALVTGGGGEGSGRAIARRFARAGAVVVVCDKNDEGGIATVQAITRDGGNATFRHVDVRSREELHDAFVFARSLGNIAAVVNNASAIEAFHPEAPLEYWDEIIETDFLGAMWSTRLAIDALRASGGGAVVNVGSTSALREFAQGGSPIYDIAKLAILRLTMRLDFLKAENIRVNCIVPHWIAVPHIVDYVSSLSNEQRKERGVPDRLIPLDEIADETYRLATDETLAGEAVIWPNGAEPVLYPRLLQT
jgi:NAD(P)-dependent dehydrogenase (short-subunit alcohol dehydrogenase family)